MANGTDSKSRTILRESFFLCNSTKDSTINNVRIIITYNGST